jgi:stress response protein YsnF
MNKEGKRKQEDRSPQYDEQVRKNRKMGNDMESSFDFCQRMTNIMDNYKTKVSTTLTMAEMENNPGCGDIKAWMVSLARHHMKGMDDMACMLTEMHEEMDNLNTELKGKDKKIRELQEELAAQDTVVKAVVVTKDKIEVKASSKEMEERLKVATTQFKVMDMDIGKETEDRKEILSRGLAAIKEKVRSDMKEEWEKLVDGAEVAPLVRKTTKPTGKSFYTAPLLFTVQDKTRRWRMEEILRNSKVYPGFHWPQEMMPVIKDYKMVLKDNGVNEDTTYIRIRPSERDGKIKLRADLKGKEGNGRFVAKAFWEAPPICPETRKKARDHLKPTWASTRG